MVGVHDIGKSHELVHALIGLLHVFVNTGDCNVTAFEILRDTAESGDGCSPFIGFHDNSLCPGGVSGNQRDLKAW